MKYKLMRCYLSKNGTLFKEVVFDLWNYEYETGYEIKVNLFHMDAWKKEIEKYTRELIGHTYDISRWDLIIRNIKQMKIDHWIVFEDNKSE